MPDQSTTQLRDEVELREWMTTTIGGLQDDRSTAAYALEFLQTQQRNLAAYQDERMQQLGRIASLEHEVAEAAIEWYQTQGAPHHHVELQVKVIALIKFKAEEKIP